MNELLKLNLQLFAEVDNGTGDDTPEVETTEEVEDEKTFTQEQVNKIATKESRKATESLLKDLGIEDFDNAKDGLEKFREWQEQQKTDSEKQQEEYASTVKERDELLNRATQLEQTIAVLRKGVNEDSVDDVVALAQRLVTDEKDIDTAVAEVLEKYPHFAQKQEVEEVIKPRFTNGMHNKSTKVDDDPFEALKQKYKRG